MTLQHTANDVGFYVGNGYNLNIPCQEFLWVLKSMLKTYNWRILASGDGDSIYSASDILTNANRNQVNTVNTPNIGNSIANARAWFLVATPIGAAVQGYWIFQNIADFFGTAIRVKFSANGYNLATATFDTTPTAALSTPSVRDEVILLGSIDDVTPTGALIASPDNGFQFNMGVQDDVNFPFFWVTTWASGVGTTVNCLLLHDYVQNRDTADTYPYVAGGLQAIQASSYVGSQWPASGGDFIPQNVSGMLASRFGDAPAHLTTPMHEITYNFSTGTGAEATFIHNMDQNTLTSKEETMNVMWGRSPRNPVATGYKGDSKYCRIPGKARVVADHLNDPTTRNFVYIHGLWLPWGLSGTDCVL